MSFRVTCVSFSTAMVEPQVNRVAAEISMVMTQDQCFSQGARCGHLEGRPRCGVYVHGEEYPLSVEAAKNQKQLDSFQQVSWAAGYRVGYLIGASGEPLPEEYAR